MRGDGGAATGGTSPGAGAGAGRVFGHYQVVPGRLRYGALTLSTAGGEYSWVPWLYSVELRRPRIDHSDHRILNLARPQQMSIS